jgi:hypothetical protein
LKLKYRIRADQALTAIRAFRQTLKIKTP